MQFRAILLLTALTSTAWCQDPDRSTQLRLGIGSMPGVDESELEGPGGTESVSLDPKAGVSVDVGLAVLWTNPDSVLGYAVYIGGFRRAHLGEDEVGVDVSTAAFGANLGVDVTAQLSPSVLLTAGPRLGLGFASQSVDDAAIEDGFGAYVSVGFQVGAYVSIGTDRLSRPILLGLEAGGMGWSSSATQTFDDGVDHADLDVTNSGGGGYVSVVIGMTI